MSSPVSGKIFYVYILRCKDDSLYIGMTSDLEKRIKAHCGIIKGGAKYTRSHPVICIESAWKAENKTAAARAEYILKKHLTRSKKLRLISEPEFLCDKYVPELSEYSFEVCKREFLCDIYDRAVNNGNTQ